MELKFEANQDHQLHAIAAVTGVFSGQPRFEADVRFALGASGFAAVANRLDLTREELLANLQAVQTANQIPRDDAMATIDAPIETAEGSKTASFYNLTVEMETGTGKTYVYIRTALQLYRDYGFRKFIVVVPSVAIREGVLKTLQITADHLRALYDNTPYRYYVYDSANLSQVRQFALSDSVEIMIMTLASFNKAANVIRQTTDRLQGETPVHLVQATRPILILDEPQNMESELSIASLALLDPLFALRYSATHRNPYNVVYRLTPYEAYRRGLVKRIDVASVLKEGDVARPYIRLDGVASDKRTLTARVTVQALTKDGTIQERTLTVRPGDSLRTKTGRGEYAGYDIEEIETAPGRVHFANNQQLAVGDALGADKEAIFEAQIIYTIQEHARKQNDVRAAGLKVLTLFFIDQVANYRTEDGQPGLIRRLFDKAFEAHKAANPDWSGLSADQVQAAYFAQRRTAGGQVVLEDTKTGEAERDREAYDLIMKDKERLLSLTEPVAFIFSHSALREGWDNPNVFQICTLNQSVSEVKKRQEVGRGIRLAVNQQGDRVHDEHLNLLTVVANESYERFAEQLQSEIAFEYRAAIEEKYGKPIGKLSDEERRRVEEEYGQGILPPKPANARERGKSRLRKEYMLRPEFQELWERIKHKTRYAVRVDTDKLVADVVAALDAAEIRPPRVTVTRAKVQVGDENAFTALQASSAKSLVSLAGRYPLPNVVDIMADLMERTTPPVRLTRQTLLKVIRQAPADVQAAMLDNPHEFASVAVRIIKEKLMGQLIDGIKYFKINAWYEMTQFDAEIESWEQYLVPASQSLYAPLITDSQVEREFVRELEEWSEVKLYIKLPRWFTVDTPLGTYNPDWAIVFEEHDQFGQPAGKPLLYLVCETKQSWNPAGLRPDEARKVACGEKHFEEALNVPFFQVGSRAELQERLP